MTPWRTVEPEKRATGATVWRAFDCARCGRKIFQVYERPWTKDGKRFYHDLCKELIDQKEAKS